MFASTVIIIRHHFPRCICIWWGGDGMTEQPLLFMGQLRFRFSWSERGLPFEFPAGDWAGGWMVPSAFYFLVRHVWDMVKIYVVAARRPKMAAAADGRLRSRSLAYYSHRCNISQFQPTLGPTGAPCSTIPNCDSSSSQSLDFFLFSACVICSEKWKVIRIRIFWILWESENTP